MDGYKELLAKLSALVDTLEKGELDREQLNELESITRQLHERSIIIRYKAYEGESVNDSVQVSVEEDEVESPEENDISSPVEFENNNEVESQKEEADVEVEETAFDFDMFDTESEATQESAEPQIEEEEVIEVPAPPVQEDKQEEVVAEATDEAPHAEVEDTSATPIESNDNSNNNAFLDKLAVQDNSLASRFSAGPLDSLIGAFGLNERLRFINDLFDGSSEKFSDAIKALDSQSDLDAARNKAAGYAHENDWDPEEEVVIEFMNYLNRRYA